MSRRRIRRTPRAKRVSALWQAYCAKLTGGGPYGYGYPNWAARTRARWDAFWEDPQALTRIMDFLHGFVNVAQLSDAHCASCKARCAYITHERKERLAREAAA